MIDKFETQSEDSIRKALAANTWQTRQSLRDDLSLAVDFLEGRQREHTEAELMNRYPARQNSNHPITPITIPLTRRYVLEAANAYSQPVQRELVNASGEVDEEVTDALHAALEEVAYDKHMHRVEQLMVLCRTAINWYQVKRGKLHMAIVLPQDLYSIPDSADVTHDPSDPNDYLAHVIELTSLSARKVTDDRQFVWVSPAETVFYRGQSPFASHGAMEEFPNPFLWPQVGDASLNLAKPTVKWLPLSPLVFWSDSVSMGGLINDNDADIARLNLEINVQLSMLFDTIGHQGWGQAVIRTMNPENAPATIAAGATQAVCLGPEEAMEYLQSGAPYESIVSALRFFVQLEALANRQSPNDFSIDGPSATSGFAKLVDSLPKLEARSERVSQLSRIEATDVWPRLATTLNFTGRLKRSVDELTRMRLRTRFSDIEFPESASEQATRESHELSQGLVSRAALISRREGISAAEVEARLEDEAEVERATTPMKRDGSQSSPMSDIVEKVATGKIPRDSGLAILLTAFDLDDEQAAQVMGSAGLESSSPTPTRGDESRSDNSSAQPSPPLPAQEPRPGFADLVGGLIGRRGRD